MPPDPGARRTRRGPAAQAASQRRSRSSSGRLLGVLFAGLAVFGALLGTLITYGAVTAASAYERFARDLPSVSHVSDRPIFKTTQILDRNGKLIYELFDPDRGKRTVVPLADLPEDVARAFVAVEDSSFYDNPGVDPRGILRA